jgi:hypothetical protein
MITETDEKASSARNLSFLLRLLEGKNYSYYSTLHEHPRYTELVKKIKADISEA